MISEPTVIWEPQPGSQTRFLTCPYKEVLFEGTRGNGKMLPNDTPVLTPSGFRKHGDLKRGQRVCTPDGSTATVTHVFQHPQRECFKLTFDDGCEVIAGDEHLWKFKVTGNATRFQYDWQWDDTKEMLRHFNAGRSVLIPTTLPVYMQQPPRLKEYPIDPYIYGLLLGDGSLSQGVGFTSADIELQELVKGVGFKRHPSNAEIDLTLNKADDATGIWSALKQLGAFGKRSWEKEVHRLFKFAPVAVRLGVLQGLMDTDGTVGKEGDITFCSVSKQLALDVQYLARSLGARATLTQYPAYLNGERKRDYFEIYMQPAGKFEPFRLYRKQQRVTGYMHAELCRRVVAIEPAGLHDCTCIRINHPEHLYIVTDGFIVTHNTDALLMDYAQFVGIGFKAAWKGVLFRETYPQLADVVAKSRKWFHQIFPSARFNSSDYEWHFADGEVLKFSYGSKEDDYWNWHGHELPWLGFEELTNQASGSFYFSMMSCNRSSHGDDRMPRHIRSTANPWGAGHHWVKQRFIDKAAPEKAIDEIVKNPVTGDTIKLTRCYIHGHWEQNKKLLAADPLYIANIQQEPDEAKRKAWLDGDWNIAVGGIFGQYWRPDVHIIEPFKIPHSWRVERSFDWGSSKPFSVGWWAIADGTAADLGDGRKWAPYKGSRIRINEWYGCKEGHNVQPNQGLEMLAADVASGIVSREATMIEGKLIAAPVRPGPADSSIFDKSNGQQNSIAELMATSKVRWVAADKSPGSRVNGWELLRNMFAASLEVVDGQVLGPKQSPMEKPGIFVFNTCRHWIRTVPTLPRDPNKPDDVQTDAEDHCFTAGTIIRTDRGLVPIKDLVNSNAYVIGIMGELVQQRNCRLTRKSSPIVEITFGDGTIVKCTPDHLFMTKDGWKPAIDLSNETVYDLYSVSIRRLWWSHYKLAIQSKSSTALDITCAVITLSRMANHYIEWYLSIASAQYQKAITYITRTKTKATTRVGILKRCSDLITHVFTQPSGQITDSQKAPEKKQQSGMDRRMEKHGILSKVKRTICQCLPKRCLVNGVRKPLMFAQVTSTTSDSAPMLAQHLKDAPVVSITKQESVSSVEQSSFAINMRNQIVAVNHVQQIKDGKLFVKNVENAPNEDVYCLSVPGRNAFTLGNGAIVKNCGDETRYQIYRKSQVTSSQEVLL